MAEKIKRTHAERDALLSKVFDSTLQTKDIEITEAGTMEIVADADFFALKKVNVNVNVQGGSGGEGGGEDSLVYYDVTKFEKRDYNTLISIGPALMKTENGIYGGIHFGALVDFTTGITAIAMSKVAYQDSAGTLYTADALSDMGVAQLGFVEITKEEFYAL